MNAYEKIAKILRVEPDFLQNFDSKMSAVSGRKGVIEALYEENENKVSAVLNKAGLDRQAKAEDVYHYIIDLLYRTDLALFEIFKRPSGQTASGMKTLFNFANEIARPQKVWVLKKDKAAEILFNNPPPTIISAFGYSSVDQLLAEKDFMDIFSALRFVESKEWMHKTFDNAYVNLTPQDFEWRPMEISVLDKEWLEIAEKFMHKKYHNVSHLKELGSIFVIPLKIDTPGETARVFSLILHYLFEVQFYSELFRNYSESKDFGKNLTSLLRGDVPEPKEMQPNKAEWLIIQRYLAKDNPDDPLLKIPHISPEAMHWNRAEIAISEFGSKFPELELTFWENLSYIGDFFQTQREYKLLGPRQPEKSGEILVSFDLVDNIMSLVQVRELAKYLYHHEESLWNRIFTGYFSHQDLHDQLVKNFQKGVVSYNLPNFSS